MPAKKSPTNWNESLKASAVRLRAKPALSRSETFIEWVTRVRPKFQWYRHNIELAGVLQRVADGELSRVMVFCPPRHGKSEEVSRLFSAYYLYRHPDRFVGVNSYSSGLAYTLSRAARDNYKNAGGVVKPDADAVGHWETTSGGGFWAAGVGGPITGKGFHLGIIDDPLKNAEEAASETIREKQKEWYASTFYTREEPGGAIIVVQTRWNEDDLSGWLLSCETEGDDPEKWYVVNLPALSEPQSAMPFPPTCTVHPDWREEGEPLCPERYTLAKLRKICQRVGEYVWNALFQQRPRPKDGLAFRRAWFADNLVDAAPLTAQYVRYWDKAASKKATADWTVGVLMCRCHVTGLFYVVDVKRGQWETAERETHIRETAHQDAARYGDVHILLEQEGGSSGIDAARASVTNLSGFPVASERPTGEKSVRFEPFAAQAAVHNVKFVRGAWNRPYVEELCALWNGRHDDQADATSGAFNYLCRLAYGSSWFVA